MTRHVISTAVAALIGSAIIAAVAMLLAPIPVHAQGDGWWSRQYRSDGGYCCQSSDGHTYWGDYTLNPDGSISMPVEGGGTLTIAAGKVLPFNPTDPNPTGAAALWYRGALAAGDGDNVYCFSIGPLT